MDTAKSISLYSKAAKFGNKRAKVALKRLAASQGNSNWNPFVGMRFKQHGLTSNPRGV